MITGTPNRKKVGKSQTGERNFEAPQVVDLPLVRTTEHSNTANSLNFDTMASAFGEDHGEG